MGPLLQRFVAIAAFSLAIGCSSSSNQGVGPTDKPPVSQVEATLLVAFHDGVPDARAGELLAAWKGTAVFESRFTRTQRVAFPSQGDARKAMVGLAAAVEVELVQRDAVCEGAGVGPSPLLDPDLLRMQWNLPAMRLPGLMAPKMPAADGVLVAVLDTGVAYEDHAGFARASSLAGTAFAAGWDFVNDDAHPNDDHQHGTHVASVIAASSGLRAVAPGAVIMPVKVLDAQNRGSELTVAEGIYFAVQGGAKVINMSLAFPPGYIPGRVLGDAIDHAAAEGVVLVAAAGNHAEGVVTYPAAFREVIAVGASKLTPTSFLNFQQWANAERALDLADYSNRGARLDVLAPGGMVDEDLDGDLSPEAILGQTFELGAPAQFGFFSSAGTSQAAAEVSGLAALLLAENAALPPYEVRALLGEHARDPDGEGLSPGTGRGFVSGDHALLAAFTQKSSRKQRPIFFANVALTLHQRSQRVARALVEVLGPDRKVAAGVKVHGTFVGGGFTPVSGTTNADGLVVFEATLASDTKITTFQIDAVVTDKRSRWGASVDRPRGFIRIGAGSLDLLSQFGTALAASGAGVGPSPLLVSYAPAALPGDTSYVGTVNLVNWSWSLATLPIAVAADEAWYMSLFPDASLRRAVSGALGVRPSPLKFDGATSFPQPLSTTLPDSLGFFVATYVSNVDESPLASLRESVLGVGASPLIPDVFNDPIPVQIEQVTSAPDAFWAYAMGVGPSPLWDPSKYGQLGLIRFEQLGRLIASYAPFGRSSVSKPVALLDSVLVAAGVRLYSPSVAISGLGAGFAKVVP